MLGSFLLSLTLAATPGPTTFFVLHRCLAEGRWRAWLVASGAAVANLVFTVTAALSLSVLLCSHPALLRSLQMISVPYLLGFSLQCARHSRHSPSRSQDSQRVLSLGSSVAQGLLFNLSNPLTAGLFLVVLPSSLTQPTIWKFLGLGVFHTASVYLFHGVWIAWTGKYTARSSSVGGPRQGLYLTTAVITSGFGLWQLYQIL